VAQTSPAKAGFFPSSPCPANIFLDGDAIELPIATPKASYVVWDAWGTEVRRGQTNDGVIRPGVMPHGSFTVEVQADRPQPQVTRLIVLSPYDLSKIPQSPFGVMTHFSAGWQPDIVPALARAGIKHVRDEIFWDAIEKQKSVFVFPGYFDRYMQILDEHHISPLVPMTFGNSVHYDVPKVPMYKAAPYKPEQFEAYARYCQEVLKHYGKQIDAVEIWNEYNGNFAGGPADGRPEVYRQMLIPAYKAIKEVRPDVKVLAGGTIGIPLEWLETVFQDGGIESCDAVSVHPYGYLLAPEHLTDQLEALHSLIRQNNHGQT
jgi:hypothetical protein